MRVFGNTVPTHIDTSSEILGYALGLFGSGSDSGSGSGTLFLAF